MAKSSITNQIRIGSTYGDWKVIDIQDGILFYMYKKPYYCECLCGQKESLSFEQLRFGWATEHPCGIVRYEGRLTDLPEYNSWRSMKARCYDPKHIGYKNYGGRGITICKKWRKDFLAFLADMGQKPTPKHSIERKNNDGNYEPKNCKWATSKEQAANKRKRSKKLGGSGVSKTLSNTSGEN